MNESPRTSYNLLLALRDYGNAAAWQRFLHQYGPMILAWCRRRGLQDADADEVTGMVLLKLAQRMHHFEYDPQSRFRGWLRTVVDSQIREFLSSRLRNPLVVGGEPLPDPAAPAEDLEAALESILEPDVTRAMESVRQRVEDHTWRAFVLTVCEGRKGSEAATELGLSVASVHQARSRVARMLREEIARGLRPAPLRD